MRTKMTIYLNQVERVKEFVEAANKFESDVDILMGRYIVDAKSILGIFSLDLSKPISLEIDDESQAKAEEIQSLLKDIQPFLAE